MHSNVGGHRGFDVALAVHYRLQWLKTRTQRLASACAPLWSTAFSVYLDGYMGCLNLITIAAGALDKVHAHLSHRNGNALSLARRGNEINK